MKWLIFLFVFILSVTVFAQETFQITKQRNVNALIQDKSNKEASGSVNRVLQDSIIQITDSIYFWDFEDNYNWKLSERFIGMLYDNKNNLKSYTAQYLENNIWKNALKYTYTHNVNNDETSELEQHWNGLDWENNDLKLTSYDKDFRISSQLSQNYYQNKWWNLFLHTYFYDSVTNNYSYISQQWFNEAWLNQTKGSYFYDDNGNLSSYIIQWWKDSVWLNSNRTLNTYDTNNRLACRIAQIWNVQEWENNQKDSSYYDVNGNLLKKFRFNWNGNSWENSLQTSNTFDAGLILSAYTEVWDEIAWMNASLTNYKYDLAAQKSEKLYQLWNNGSWQKRNLEKLSFYFYGFLRSETFFVYEFGLISSGDSIIYYNHSGVIYDNIHAELDLNVYPNPSSSGKFNVSSMIDFNSFEIYNFIGEKLDAMSLPNPKSSFDIDLSNKPPGVYIVNFKNINGGNKSKKLIVY